MLVRVAVFQAWGAVSRRDPGSAGGGYQPRVQCGQGASSSVLSSSASASANNRDTCVIMKATGEFAHLPVLVVSFYTLLSSAGGRGAAAPLTGRQPCVLLPPHPVAMCSHAVHNTWGAEAELSVQHLGGSRARSLWVWVRVGCMPAITLSLS